MRIFAVCGPRRPLELCFRLENSRILTGSPKRPASRAVQPVGGGEPFYAVELMHVVI